MSNNTPLNILLIDDHTILRQGLKQLLSTVDDFHIVGEAKNGEEGIIQAISLKPDVILMDINMPQVNGFEASKAILMAWPAARILILTNQDDGLVVKKFTDLNIYGFLLKDVELDKLTRAIRNAAAGTKTEISDELAQKVERSGEAETKQAAQQADLTEREQEVLTELAKGRSNQELADFLSVSPKTINNHLYNIYGKLGTANRSETIVWALNNGFKAKQN